MLSLAARRAAAPAARAAPRTNTRNIYYIARGDAARHATPKMSAPFAACAVSGAGVFAMGAAVVSIPGVLLG